MKPDVHLSLDEAKRQRDARVQRILDRVDDLLTKRAVRSPQVMRALVTALLEEIA